MKDLVDRARKVGRRRRGFAVLVVAATVAVMAQMPSALADSTATVSGAITSNADGSAISGATVDFVDDSTSTDVATVTTDASGQYSAQIPLGTYDITFALSNGYAPTTLSNYAITGDTTLNEALVPAPPAPHTISGVVNDEQGNPVAGATFTVYNHDGSTAASTTTAADGSYSVSAACESRCSLRLKAGTDVNNYVQYDGFGAGFTATTDKVLNYNFPALHPETVHVTGSGGDPVAGVVLGDARYGYTAYETPTIDGVKYDVYHEIPAVTTDSSGNAVVYGFNDPFWGVNFSATPPSGSSYMATGFGITAFDGGTYNLTLTAPPAPHAISGVVNDADGNPVVGAVFTVYSQGNQVATATTGPDGSYTASAACQSGCLFRLQVGSAVNNNIRYDTGAVRLNDDLVLNINLPELYAETVHVVGVGGAAVSGVVLGDPRYGYAATTNSTINGVTFAITDTVPAATTDTNGDAVVYGLNDPVYGVNFSATPPADSGYNSTGFGISTFDGGTYTLTLAAPPTPHIISGVVQDDHGDPVSGATFSVFGSDGSTAATATTAADGSYSVSAACESRCSLRLKASTAVNDYVQYDGFGAGFTATTDKVLNYTFPALHPETIHVVGSNGKPLAGVTLGDARYGYTAYETPTIDGVKYDVYHTIPAVTTDSSGNAVVYGFNDPFWGINFSATPPAESPYSSTSFGLTTFDGGTYILRFVAADAGPPVVAGTASPAPNADGWNNTPVTVTWSATDDSGSATQPAATTISSEGANQSAVSAPSCDPSQNCATGSVNGINIDRTPPTITASLSSSPNADGWNNGDVTVTFHCADTLSGIKSCPEPVTVHDGAGQVVRGTAVDKADNTSSTSVTVNVDSVKPTITATLSSSPNADGWNNSDVTVTFNCSDADSGITGCSTPVVVHEGAGQVVSGTATDDAGNTASTSVTLNVDKTKPTIVASVNQAANANGWNNGDVTVTFACGDELSTVKTCSKPVTLTNDGANQVVTGTAVDYAGNTATATVVVSIDKTKPMIAAIITPTPNTAGWNNSNVTVSYTCSDALSGIASCSGPSSVKTEGANQTVSGTAVDNAGNTAMASAKVSLDKTVPTETTPTASQTTLLSPGSVKISTTVGDSLSGVVAVEYYVDIDPGVGNGHAMTVSGATASASVSITGNPLSTHVVGVRTEDRAGNWSAVKTVSISLIL